MAKVAICTIVFIKLTMANLINRNNIRCFHRKFFKTAHGSIWPAIGPYLP
jgi:hypothetical protein